MSTRRFLALSLCLLTAACYGPEEFQEEAAILRCALYEECGYLSNVGADDYDHCLEILRSDDYACEEFQTQAAEECLEALDSLSCQDYGGGLFPMSCVDACSLADD